MTSLIINELSGLEKTSTDTPIVASGGTVYDIYENSRHYRVHVFTSSAEFKVTNAGSLAEVEYLIVAGGGGGGGVIGGGGGAGGLLTGMFTVSAQSYPIIVGSGGLGGFSWNSSVQLGFSGTESSAFGFTALGGGGGGAHGGNDVRTSGSVGGSGGGAGNQVAGAAGTAGQGFGGGAGAGASGQGNNGGGGGGAAMKGFDGVNGVKGGEGGQGLPSSLIGSTNWYAGGGGGGTRNTFGIGGIGGKGGGGNGGTTDTVKSSTDGSISTGGGGGGGGHNGSTAGAVRSAGNGGSGIVILRYPIPSFQPIVATGGDTYTVYENGVTYKVHDFRSTGSSNFTVSSTGTDGYIEYLLVGGGGGGGGRHGGGGGGGGFSVGRLSLTAATYSVIVGSGGGGAQTDVAGNSGNDSAIILPNSYSVYFDGNGDTIRTNSVNISSGPFTVEAWVFLIAMPTTDSWPASFASWMEIVGVGTASQADGWQFRIGTTVLAFGTNADSTAVSGLHNITIGTWNHLACVRNGNVYTLYVNGNNIASATYTANAPGTGSFTWIGSESNQGAYLNGFISNLRITASALYTSNFSPSRLPLTNIANTRLLACQNATLTETAFNYTLVVSGDVRVSLMNPFTAGSMGGGGGGSYGGAGYPPGKVGGSGGGGGHAPSVGAVGILGQGYAGGNGLSNEGAGGGGAGGIGENGHTFGGRGGPGLPSNITGTNYYFSGGGGGGGWETGAGAGGIGGGGGGGAGGTTSSIGFGGQLGINPGANGVAGTTGAVSGGAGGANTGGGGGGSGQRENAAYTGVGGNGGSGIVVLRYPLTLKKIITVPSTQSIYSPNNIVQVKYVRTDNRTFYTAGTTGDGISIPDLALTVKPRKANSMIMLTWMINGEVHQDVVFLVHMNGQLIQIAGYEGFNRESGNVRWSGITASNYEFSTPDYSTTAQNFLLRHLVPALNTDVRTYTPAIRSSSTTAYNLHLNRVQNSATGANNNEMTVSTGVLMELSR